MPIFNLNQDQGQQSPFAALRRKNPFLTPPFVGEQAKQGPPPLPDIPDDDSPGANSAQPSLSLAEKQPDVRQLAAGPGPRSGPPPVPEIPNETPAQSSPEPLPVAALQRMGLPPDPPDSVSLSPSIDSIRQLRPMAEDPRQSRQLPPPVPADLAKALAVQMPERPHDKWYQRVGHALGVNENLVHPIYSDDLQRAQQQQGQALQRYGLIQMANKEQENSASALAKLNLEQAQGDYYRQHAANLKDETGRRSDRDADAAQNRAEANRVRDEGRLKDLLHDGAQVITDRRDTVAFPQLPGMPDQKFAPPTPPPMGYTELPDRVAGARIGVPSVEQKRAEQRIYQVPQDVADTLNLDAGQPVDKVTYDQAMRNYRQRTGDKSRESRTAVTAQSRVTAAGIRKGGGGTGNAHSDKQRLEALAGGYLQAAGGDPQKAHELAMHDNKLDPADLPFVARTIKATRLPQTRGAGSDLQKLTDLVKNMPGPKGSGVSAAPPSPPTSQAGPGTRPSPATAVIAPAPPPVRVGQTVRLKNGQMVTVKAVHPDGSFE